MSHSSKKLEPNNDEIKTEDESPIFVPQFTGRKVEYGTFLLIVFCYASWLILTFYFRALPSWFAIVAGALLVCLHGSLQHEIIHGHPTRSRLLNTVLAYPPLGLFYPYPIYRKTHLIHHQVPTLTDPVNDPESFYSNEEQWAKLTPLARALLKVNQTLAGRLVLGPALSICFFYREEITKLLHGNRQNLPTWITHIALVIVLLFWVVGYCRITPVEYFLFFAYPALALTLLRSYAEHKPSYTNSESSAIVESSPVFQLLYLNNNFHWVHHQFPSLPWYCLKDVYFKNKDRVLSENGSYLFKGYGQVAAQFLFKCKDSPALGTEFVPPDAIDGIVTPQLP